MVTTGRGAGGRGGGSTGCGWRTCRTARGPARAGRRTGTGDAPSSRRGDGSAGASSGVLDVAGELGHVDAGAGAGGVAGEAADRLGRDDVAGADADGGELVRPDRAVDGCRVDPEYPSRLRDGVEGRGVGIGVREFESHQRGLSGRVSKNWR